MALERELQDAVEDPDLVHGFAGGESQGGVRGDLATKASIATGGGEFERIDQRLDVFGHGFGRAVIDEDLFDWGDGDDGTARKREEILVGVQASHPELTGDIGVECARESLGDAGEVADETVEFGSRGLAFGGGAEEGVGALESAAGEEVHLGDGGVDCVKGGLGGGIVGGFRMVDSEAADADQGAVAAAGFKVHGSCLFFGWFCGGVIRTFQCGLAGDARLN